MNNQYNIKSYNVKNIEKKWHNLWEQSHIFTPKNVNTHSPSYTIMMPPPNITGILHNGHALGITLEDILSRYYRMNNYNTLWLPGIDHAGIATQTMIEKTLIKQTQTHIYKLNKKQILKEIWKWKKNKEHNIIKQLKKLGASSDWSRWTFTFNKHYSKAVKTAFVKMWNDNLIYRKERIINWDPIANTALSNEEIEYTIQNDTLFFFNYKINNITNQTITVATTRLETMLGDVAIAVNPKDIRYKTLIGQTVKHPFFPNRIIPIISDNYVDMKFGTGAVKITPAHDQNDFLIGKKNNLKIINLFNTDLTLNKNCGIYAGLNPLEAQKQIKHDLIKLKLFKNSINIKHSVAISQRTHARIEPMILKQYFIKMQTLANNAIYNFNTYQTTITPNKYKKILDHFLYNIEDWCISRQLLWGHQIPIFYNIKQMKIIIKKNKNIINPNSDLIQTHNYNLNNKRLLKLALKTLDDKLIKLFSIASIYDLSNNGTSNVYYQDQDVLDTWFSSALWPLSTLGWPYNTKDLEVFYPTQTLETGCDILFFWVARMMMFGLYFMHQIPFKEIFLHPIIRDSKGQKMSKSLGNTIDPIDVIQGITLHNLTKKINAFPIKKSTINKIANKINIEFPNGIIAYGSDALRLSLSTLSNQGQKINFSIQNINIYKHFLNKLWHATQFIMLNIQYDNIIPINSIEYFSLPEQWILSKLQNVIYMINMSIKMYNFNFAIKHIYNFFWNDFCNWYIEISKIKFDYNIDIKMVSSTLVEILDATCRLLHPFCPHITEEIWSNLPIYKQKWKKQNIYFCATAPFPKPQQHFTNNNAESIMHVIKSIISTIRNIKHTINIRHNTLIDIIITSKNNKILNSINKLQHIIKKISYIKTLKIIDNKYNILKNTIIYSITNINIILPQQNIQYSINEKHKLQNKLTNIKKNIFFFQQRINTTNFIKNAPNNIIKETINKLKELEKTKKNIEFMLN